MHRIDPALVVFETVYRARIRIGVGVVPQDGRVFRQRQVAEQVIVDRRPRPVVGIRTSGLPVAVPVDRLRQFLGADAVTQNRLFKRSTTSSFSSSTSSTDASSADAIGADLLRQAMLFTLVAYKRLVRAHDRVARRRVGLVRVGVAVVRRRRRFIGRIRVGIGAVDVDVDGARTVAVRPASGRGVRAALGLGLKAIKLNQMIN